MNYIERIQAAVDFIESHLGEDIATHDVCSAIGFSGYHFHRIFQGMLGESVAEYIRKRRLSEAAHELKSSDRPILDIAYAAQFDTQESFTRAFKKMFGVNPNQFRKDGSTSAYYKRRTTTEMIEHLQKDLTLEPVYKSFDGDMVVGIARAFDEACDEGIAKLWDEFVKRQSEIKDVKEGYALGLCMASHPEIAKTDGQFVYMSALPVNKVDALPQGMVSHKIPKGKYAVFTHKGSLSTLLHTVNYIWGTWVPKNIQNYSSATAIDFELYDWRFSPDTLSGEMDIYIPVGIS